MSKVSALLPPLIEVTEEVCSAFRFAFILSSNIFFNLFGLIISSDMLRVFFFDFLFCVCNELELSPPDKNALLITILFLVGSLII